MMVRYKDRPCPGCGEVGSLPPQTLCPQCRRQLRLGKEREREILEFSRSQLGDKIVIAVDTDFAYGIGRGGPQTAFLAFSHDDLLDTLIRLSGLEKATGSGGIYSDARWIWFKYSIGSYRTKARHLCWATVEQADGIDNILGYINTTCKLWYRAGLERGSNLLQRLAEAGVNEFNQITVEAGKRGTLG